MDVDKLAGAEKAKCMVFGPIWSGKGYTCILLEESGKGYGFDRKSADHIFFHFQHNSGKNL